MTDRASLDSAPWILWRDNGAQGWSGEPFDSLEAAQREVANNGYGTARITPGFAWPPRESSPLVRYFDVAAELERERARQRASIKGEWPEGTRVLFCGDERAKVLPW